MYKLRSIVGFYIAVAVLLTVALMPFEKNIVPAVIFADREENTDAVFAEKAESLSFGEIKDNSTQMSTEILSEEIAENKTDIPVELFVEDVLSENTVAVTEQAASKTETGIKEENTSEDIVISEVFKPVYYNSYKPDTYENIYPLYFFSENTGSLEASDSVNVYTFSLEKRCAFQYVFSHKEIIGTAGWEISLYGEYYLNGTDGETAYRLLNTLISEPTVTKQQSVKLGLIPGNYRLVVTKGMAFTSDGYRIDVTAEYGSDYEIECNDNIYRYTSLFSSVPIKGTASYFKDRQDEDWYMFRQYEDGFAQLKFEHPAIKDKTTVCWQIILYSENGTALYSVNSLFTDELVRSGAIGLSAGNYYVLVRNRVYADMPYTLTLSRADDVSYEVEKNDTKETATEISVNSTVTGSVAERLTGIDRDYFKFDVPSSGTLMLEFSHIATAEDKNGWNFVLTDDSGEVLFKGISAWSDDVSTSSHIGLGKGTYYVLVDSDNLYLNSEDYYLTVSFTTFEGWETEANNSFSSSDILLSDTAVTGLIADCGGADSDYDYYSFTLTEESDVSLMLEHEILGNNRNIFNVTLYDESFNPVECTVGEATGITTVRVLADAENTQANYEALSAGTYYVKVTSGIYYESIIYYLYYII